MALSQPETSHPMRGVRVGSAFALVGLLVLAAGLGAALPAWSGSAPRTGPSGLAVASGSPCPSSEGNRSGLALTTNVTSGPAPLAVQFCGFSPTALSASFWWFGDGSSSTLANTTHTFESGGSYDVFLNVTYAAGGSGSANVVITATGGSNATGSGGGNGSGSGGSNGTGPEGNETGNGSGVFYVIAIASPTTALAPAEIYFNATVTGGVAPYTYRWTFGDGGNGSGQYPTHLYTVAGTYLPNVEVRDSTGRTTNGSTSVTITTNRSSGTMTPLHLELNATPLRGNAPLNVTFSASASGGTAPYSYHLCPLGGSCGFTDTNWTSGGYVITSEYPTSGNYTATATVEDSAGNQSIATIPIEVTVGPPLNVTVNESAASGSAPLAVGFVATVHGGTSPYSIQWSWGDGTVGSSTSGAVVAHAYTVAGTYTPSLTVTDAAGHHVTITLGAVNVTAPTVPSTSKPSGLLPSGGSTAVVLEYLGIAAIGAVVSGLGVGLLLRRRSRQKEGASLVEQLETTASGRGTPPNGPGSER